MNPQEAKKLFSAEVKKIITAYYPHLDVETTKGGGINIIHDHNSYFVALVVTIGPDTWTVTTVNIHCHHQIGTVLRAQLQDLQSLAEEIDLHIIDIPNAEPKSLTFLSS